MPSSTRSPVKQIRLLAHNQIDDMLHILGLAVMPQVKVAEMDELRSAKWLRQSFKLNRGPRDFYPVALPAVAVPARNQGQTD